MPPVHERRRCIAGQGNPRPTRRHSARRTATDPKERIHMTWQTPQATDFRFGFEITMYAAAR